MHRFALLVVLASLALSAVSLIYISRELGINTSTTDMIASDVPFRQASRAYDRAFPQFDDNIVVVIEAISAGIAPETVEQAANRLADVLAGMPTQFTSVLRPGSEQFFQENGLLFLDIEELYDLSDHIAEAEPLLGALARDPSLRGLADIISTALEADQTIDSAALENAITQMAVIAEAMDQDSPLTLSWTNLLNGDDAKETPGRAFVLIRPILDFSSLKPAARALETIRSEANAQNINASSGLRMRITGSAAIEQEELESVEIGGKTAGYLSIALVTLLLLMGLKSVRLVAVAVATLAMGLIWTAALATATVGELNLLSVAFAVLFIGLGVDFSIHFALRYLETDISARNNAEALMATGESVGGALTLSAVCAAAGFFAFMPTDYVGLAELGQIAGMGMFVALAANLTVLPALLKLAKLKTVLNSQSPGAAKFANFLQLRAKPILGCAGIVGLASLLLIPSMTFDFNPINLRDPSSESVATYMDLAADPDSSFYSIDLLVPGIEDIDAATDALQSLEQVGTVISVASFVPNDQDKKLALIDELAFVLAGVLAPLPQDAPATAEENREIAANFIDTLAARSAQDDALGTAAGRLAQAITSLGTGNDDPSDTTISELERRFVTNVPYMFDRLDAALLAAPVDLETMPENIISQWVSADGQARMLIQPASGITSNKDLQVFADAVSAVASGATGTPVIVTEAGRVILNAFFVASAIAFIAIIAILFAMLRRPADVLLILLPLILSAAMTIAIAVIFGLTFNFANIIVLPLLLGLGIASAIHLVMRWRRAGNDMSIVASSTPRAVFFSAMTTIAAFGSLTVSGHLGMRSMGLLLAIALTSTLISTLIVLPSLMTVFGGRSSRSENIPPQKNP